MGGGRHEAGASFLRKGRPERGASKAGGSPPSNVFPLPCGVPPRCQAQSRGQGFSRDESESPGQGGGPPRGHGEAPGMSGLRGSLGSRQEEPSAHQGREKGSGGGRPRVQGGTAQSPWEGRTPVRSGSGPGQVGTLAFSIRECGCEAGSQYVHFRQLSPTC